MEVFFHQPKIVFLDHLHECLSCCLSHVDADVFLAVERKYRFQDLPHLVKCSVNAFLIYPDLQNFPSIQTKDITEYIQGFNPF